MTLWKLHAVSNQTLLLLSTNPGMCACFLILQRCLYGSAALNSGGDVRNWGGEHTFVYNVFTPRLTKYASLRVGRDWISSVRCLICLDQLLCQTVNWLLRRSSNLKWNAVKLFVISTNETDCMNFLYLNSGSDTGPDTGQGRPPQVTDRLDLLIILLTHHLVCKMQESDDMQFKKKLQIAFFQNIFLKYLSVCCHLWQGRAASCHTGEAEYQRMMCGVFFLSETSNRLSYSDGFIACRRANKWIGQLIWHQYTSINQTSS